MDVYRSLSCGKPALEKHLISHKNAAWDFENVLGCFLKNIKSAFTYLIFVISWTFHTHSDKKGSCLFLFFFLLYIKAVCLRLRGLRLCGILFLDSWFLVACAFVHLTSVNRRTELVEVVHGLFSVSRTSSFEHFFPQISFDDFKQSCSDGKRHLLSVLCCVSCWYILSLKLGNNESNTLSSRLFRSSEKIFGQNSGWLFLDAAESLYLVSCQSCYLFLCYLGFKQKHVISLNLNQLPS